jgi:hypothetical protein
MNLLRLRRVWINRVEDDNNLIRRRHVDVSPSLVLLLYILYYFLNLGGEGRRGGRLLRPREGRGPRLL